MTDTATLIPRNALFGNPTRAAGQISPDGQWLSWLAPKDGVLNIWLAPASDPQAARAVTQAVERPIRQYFWSPDASAVMYIQDKGGDENFLLYRVDVTTGAETTLTPDGDRVASETGTPVTWTEGEMGRALFYYDGVVNQRFLTVHS